MLASWLSTQPSDWRAAAKCAAIVCPLWCMAQGTYNMSLVTTSVASSTALSATSCVFTFFLSVCVFRRSGTLFTCLGVVSTLLGAVLVGMGDGGSSSSSTSWKGNTLALLSAAGYASYSLAIKLWVPEEKPPSPAAVVGEGGGGVSGGDAMAVAHGGEAGAPSPHAPKISMLVFFGFLGLWTSLGLSPVVAALHVTGVEDISGWLGNGWAVVLVALKGLFDNVLSDLLWAKAIQLTSPTLAAVGLSLTIPMALLSDLAIDGLLPTPLGALGALFIFTGFVCCALGEA